MTLTDHAQVQPKKAYKAPELKIYGRVQDLTLTSNKGGPTADNPGRSRHT